MMTTSDWERWEESWREARTTPAELEELIERTSRARRAILLLHVLSGVLAVAALTGIGVALRHAGNRVEAALGLLVSVAIAAAWLVDAVGNRGATGQVEAVPSQYVAMRRALCERRLRFARLGWIVVALDLAFLGPWWIGGISVHGMGVDTPRLLTMWAPLAAMIGFVGWTLRVRATALAELTKLAETAAAHSEPSSTDR